MFALRVIKQFLSSGPKTREELLKLTGLPDRTLRYNLRILKRRGTVKEIPLLSDLRKKLFIIKDQGESV